MIGIGKIRSWQRWGIIVPSIWIAGFWITGCVTTGGSVKSSYSNISQIQEADRFFDKQQYQTALLKYSAYLYAPFPDKKHEDYALYKMSLCQFLVGQYQDAQKSVNSLISQYPQFEYLAQAKELLSQCDAKINEQNQERSVQWAELQQKILEQEQLVAQDPNQAALQYQLGDLYWNAGRFDQAVQQYEKSVQLDKTFLEKQTLKDRVRISADGVFHVRDALYENIKKPSPVRVVQVQRERVERRDWLAQHETLRYSGFIENTGLYDVKNVKIEMAIYDFYGTVQETKQIPIGDLKAGAKRPFSAMFSQYKGQGVDVTKYTTEIFYDEPPVAQR